MNWTLTIIVSFSHNEISFLIYLNSNVTKDYKMGKHLTLEQWLYIFDTKSTLQ